MRVRQGQTQKLLTQAQLKSTANEPKRELKKAASAEAPAAIYLPQGDAEAPVRVSDQKSQGPSKTQVTPKVEARSPEELNRNPKTLLLQELASTTTSDSGVGLAAGGPGVFQGRIDAIKNVKDPVLRNVLVSQCYTDTAREFRDCIGSDGGTNWCGWASFASDHVRVTIKGEDFPFLKPLAYVGAAAAAVVGGIPGAIAGLAVIGAVKHTGSKASRAMTKGNDDIFLRTVPTFTRFIETFKDDTEKDPDKLKKFIDEIGPDGPAEEAKFTLLKRAFSNYYEAKFESDPKKKKELVLLGNSQVVWDEQITAQKDITDAMPVGTRHLLTQNWLTVPLPDRTIRLGEDLPRLPDGSVYPKDLETIENPELKEVMDHFGVKDTTKGSGAKDYSKIDQRMHFILNFFRTHHEHPTAYDDIFTEKQLPYVRQGFLPPEDGH